MNPEATTPADPFLVQAVAVGLGTILLAVVLLSWVRRHHRHHHVWQVTEVHVLDDGWGWARRTCTCGLTKVTTGVDWTGRPAVLSRHHPRRRRHHAEQ